jgi:hypothetical protein
MLLRTQGLRASPSDKVPHVVLGHTEKRRCAPCHALQRREAVLAAGAAVLLTASDSAHAGMCVPLARDAFKV